MQVDQFKLSIVSSMYYSEDYIAEFYRRTRVALTSLSIDDYEFVLVDDGSPDSSLQKALSIREADSNVHVIELSRNFGHHKAILTGLEHARGDLIFVIDMDLEEDPGFLQVFLDEYFQGSGTQPDLVYGVQISRKGGIFERISGSVFYLLFNYLSRTKLSPNCLMSKLMTRRFRDALLRHKEHVVFLGGLIAITGFEQRALYLPKTSKEVTTYTLSVKLRQFWDSLTSFSSAPLYLIFYCGLILCMISFGGSLLLIVNRLFLSSPVPGWTSILVSIYLLGGLILASVGLVGIYIGKVFEEVKGRPLAIIKNIWG